MKTDKNASEKKENVTKEECQDDVADFSWEKERLEKHYRGKLVSVKELLVGKGLAKHEQIYNWVKSIAPYNNVDRSMLIFEKENRISIVFYTETSEYIISSSDNYLGGIVSTRKNKPGEVCERSSDLPDGKHTEETWNSIKQRIINNEIKNLQVNIKR